MSIKFGKIKSTYFNKLLESYEKNEKKELIKIVCLISENKDLRELYLLYENFETKYIDNEKIAETYVEELSKSLKSKSKLLESIDNLYVNESVETNEVYDNLDILMEEDNLLNIYEKIVAKKYLVNHLLKKKQIEENEVPTFTTNDKLLATILSNNFNTVFESKLSEEEKTKFIELSRMSQSDLSINYYELKKSLEGKIKTLHTESTDDVFKQKLDNVLNEINNTNESRYNYYKLLELKNGLD